MRILYKEQADYHKMLLPAFFFSSGKMNQIYANYHLSKNLFRLTWENASSYLWVFTAEVFNQSKGGMSHQIASFLGDMNGCVAMHPLLNRRNCINSIQRQLNNKCFYDLKKVTKLSQISFKVHRRQAAFALFISCFKLVLDRHSPTISSCYFIT